MVTYVCDACAEAYDEGGIMCPHHGRMVAEDIGAHGQPASLNTQYDSIRLGQCPP